MKFKFNTNVLILLALFIGIVSGILDNSALNQAADIFSQLFINLLKLVSTPIIFLSIFSTVAGMKSAKEFKFIGKKIIKHTLITTYIASFIALICFLMFDPVQKPSIESLIQNNDIASKGYINYLIHIVPTNIVTPFLENNVIAVLFLAIIFSLATLSLPEKQRAPLQTILSSLNSLFLKVASWIVVIIPLAVWAFITLFFKEMQKGLEIKHLIYFLGAITTANLVQGFMVLPAYIKLRGLNPIKLATQMLPALSLAFFSKSSSATLPMTMRCAVERASMDKKLSNMAFPLCTAINMNGCAAFILITVLFVSISNGLSFSIFEMFCWTFIATIAAVGNAGVPMGCFFLSSAFLASMNVPLNMMALILPFYVLIDMLETTVNVWSDSCVVALVDKEIKQEDLLDVVETESSAELEEKA